MKMTKTQGARNYNQAEQQHLLAIVSQRLPLRKADWDSVAGLYNRGKDHQWKDHSAPSLTRKLACLCSRTKDCCDASIGLIRMKALELKLKISKITQPTVHHLHAPPPEPYDHDPSPEPTENATHRDQHVEAVPDGSVVPEQAIRSSPSCAAEFTDLVHTDSCQDTPTNTTPSLPDNRGFPSPSESTADGDVDTAATPPASSPGPVAMAIEAVKPKHIHCDVIQLFLWFQRRDEQQLERWQDMERQHKLEVCAANRMQQELLECLASLNAKLTG
jgi:hypothetical protein